jgi:predicted O-methyltransferase YrrM
MKDDYQFTQDWFSWSPPVWEQVFKQLDVKNILEIGCFEGRATCWLIENASWAKEKKERNKMVCIDTFKGGEEHTPEVMDGVFRRWQRNVDIALEKSLHNPQIIIMEDDSYNGLVKLWNYGGELFDFIYIDGSHVAKDVITDACMCWPLLVEGGVMCFDDYGWGEPIPETHKPKLAIDAFITIFQEDLEVIHRGYQLIVQRVK